MIFFWVNSDIICDIYLSTGSVKVHFGFPAHLITHNTSKSLLYFVKKYLKGHFCRNISSFLHRYDCWCISFLYCHISLKSNLYCYAEIGCLEILITTRKFKNLQTIYCKRFCKSKINRHCVRSSNSRHYYFNLREFFNGCGEMSCLSGSLLF